MSEFHLAQFNIARAMAGSVDDPALADFVAQLDVMQAAADAGKLLGKRLTTGHDRAQVTQKVQKKMMDLFASST